MLRVARIMMILAIAAFFASCGKQSEEQAKKAAKIDTTTTTAEVAKPAIADTAKPAVEEPKPLVVKETPVAEKKKDPPKEKAKPEPEPEKTPLMVSIPDSTPIAVKLIDSIDTDVHVTGTKFRAVLTKPIAIGGKVAFAEGAEVIGVLDKVVESGRLKTPAELSFSLISITDGFGKPVDVTTFTIDEKKGSHTNKEVGLIGGGAVVGGIIGKLTKKKGGTAIGAAAGAAAGTAVAAATGKNDIAHSAGTEITFVLRQPVRVTVK